MDTHLSKLQERVEDRGAWSVAIHNITKSWTQLRDWTTIVVLNLCIKEWNHNEYPYFHVYIHMWSRRFSYFYRCWQTALQKGCTELHSLQQLRKGQFSHTVTSTRDPFSFLFQKRQLRVLILRSPVPLGLGGRTELIKVSFLLSPNSPAETSAQLWHVAKICTLYPKGHCQSPHPVLSLCAWVRLFSPSRVPPSRTLHNQPLFNVRL